MSGPEEADEPQQRLNFEEQYEVLSSCVSRLESGSLSLDDSLAAYRDGIEAVRRCRRVLEQAQAVVESIEDIDDEGVARTAPLNLDSESHEALRTPGRTRKRSDNPEPF